MRFLLLVVIVSMIVAGLAWFTGHVMQVRAVPVPAGPGEMASGGAAAGAAGTAQSVAASPVLAAGSYSG